MPFTLSHAAAVLPLRRSPLVLAALVAGAMAPDVPYFVRATGVAVSAGSWFEPLANGTTSHGWPGALTVSVPLGLALYGAFLVARRPLGALGPDGRPPARPVRSAAAGALLVVVSVAVGVLTHVVWDAFTHTDGWGVALVEPLQRPVGAGLTVARLLQHLSSVLGLVAVAAVAWRHRDRWLAPRGTRPARRQRLSLVWAAPAATVGALLTTSRWWGGGPRWMEPPQAVEAAVSDAVKGAGLGVVTAAAVAVAWWWLRRAAGRR